MRDAFKPTPVTHSTCSTYNQYGYCAQCGKRIMIRNSDGMIRKHDDSIVFNAYCVGSDKPPLKIKSKNVFNWMPDRRSN